MKIMTFRRQMVDDRRLEIVLCVCLVLSFAPVLWHLFQNEWAQPESGHGPIILVLSGYLYAKAWHEGGYQHDFSAQRNPLWIAFLLLACAMYFVGYVGEISQMSYGSLLAFLTAAAAAFQPVSRWRKFVFPILFLVFSIPLPGFIVDPITLPMKILVSMITESVLHAAGYPVSRAGVILNIGPYQLLVADACAGLRTLFTLEALGLLYLNMMKYASPIRNIGLAILVIPISIIANSLRVLILCLITYHFGDDVGQGFLHEFAGLALFIFGLALLLSFDGILRAISTRLESRKAVTA